MGIQNNLKCKTLKKPRVQNWPSPNYFDVTNLKMQIIAVIA